MIEKFLVPQDSLVVVEKSEVDGKTFITVTVEPKQKYKEGGFLTTVSGRCFILKNIYGSKVYDHAFLGENGLDWDNGHCCYLDDIAGYCTPEEILKVISALRKDGKRWNAKKKCIEDIPKRKFKAGDKVKIKDGISSKTHSRVSPGFTRNMDEFIGKELTVKEYDRFERVVFCEDDFGYTFAEDWLEPWGDEPKIGDWVIYWDYIKEIARSGVLTGISTAGKHKYIVDNGSGWKHAVKWDGTKEHLEKIRKGEI